MSPKRSQRLSPDVRPRHVRAHIEVDPEKSRRYRGRVEIDVELTRPTRSIELHAADLGLKGPRIRQGERSWRPTLTEHPERETIELRVPKALPTGVVTLELSFSARLRDDLRGLYFARSGKRRYAFTQLEAADARRFFPCFDEPAMKACWELSVTTAAAHSVISNSPIRRTRKHPDGRKTVHFRPTPPLSSYLVALAVGELRASRSVRCGETPIRVWAVPEKVRLAKFGLEAARASLERLEDYFDLPYPYEKLDLVAVPDFEAGAMENAGAVFFRETLLLSDPATVTLAEKKRVAEVVCHELAHMWYGDLVTMEWWNDLWLNEAFATWMAFAIVDDWQPDWRMWHDFHHYRSAAMGLDALENTHPIYTEVHTPSEATENFDLITYEKGASVVRMLERYLGANRFRKGVRRYIRKHRLGNTVAADLWNALSEASGEEVEPVVRAWIEQSGFPVVSLTRKRGRGGPRIRVRQERFHARKPRRRVRQRPWPVPLVLRIQGARGRATRIERKLVTGARDEVVLARAAPGFVHGNADAGGFYRTLHEPAELSALAAGLDALTPLERMALIGDQFALLRAGRAPLAAFLELAAAYGGQTDPDVLVAVRGPLATLSERLGPAVGDEVEAVLRSWMVRQFGDQILALGWEPERGEDEATRVRRSVVVEILGSLAEWEAVVDSARERCEAYLDDRRSLEPNLADPVVAIAARNGDGKLYRRFQAAAREAATPQERRRFLMALGAFRDRKLVATTLEASLGNEIPTQDVAILIARMLANRSARDATWRFVKRHWTALRERMPPMLVTRVIDALPELGGRANRRDVAAFFKRHPVPTGARALVQALERFDIDEAFQRKAGPELRRWARLETGS